jgi:hypothetical protein
MDDRWGSDPEPIEDSRAIQSKLLWLAACLGAAATPFAISHWMFGDVGFQWHMCVLASGCGAAVLAIFSRRERLPVAAGIVAGLVAGAGIYAATAGYVSMRQGIRFFELALPTLFGSVPGILLYIILVRVYYAFKG